MTLAEQYAKKHGINVDNSTTSSRTIDSILKTNDDDRVTLGDVLSDTFDFRYGDNDYNQANERLWAGIKQASGYNDGNMGSEIAKGLSDLVNAGYIGMDSTAADIFKFFGLDSAAKIYDEEAERRRKHYNNPDGAAAAVGEELGSMAVEGPVYGKAIDLGLGVGSIAGKSIGKAYKNKLYDAYGSELRERSIDKAKKASYLDDVYNAENQKDKAINLNKHLKNSKNRTIYSDAKPRAVDNHLSYVEKIIPKRYIDFLEKYYDRLLSIVPNGFGGTGASKRVLDRILNDMKNEFGITEEEALRAFIRSSQEPSSAIGQLSESLFGPSFITKMISNSREKSLRSKMPNVDDLGTFSHTPKSSSRDVKEYGYYDTLGGRERFDSGSFGSINNDMIRYSTDKNKVVDDAIKKFNDEYSKLADDYEKLREEYYSIPARNIKARQEVKERMSPIEEYLRPFKENIEKTRRKQFGTPSKRNVDFKHEPNKYDELWADIDSIKMSDAEIYKIFDKMKKTYKNTSKKTKSNKATDELLGNVDSAVKVKTPTQELIGAKKGNNKTVIRKEPGKKSVSKTSNKRSVDELLGNDVYLGDKDKFTRTYNPSKNEFFDSSRNIGHQVLNQKGKPTGEYSGALEFDVTRPYGKKTFDLTNKALGKFGGMKINENIIKKAFKENNTKALEYYRKKYGDKIVDDIINGKFSTIEYIKRQNK